MKNIEFVNRVLEIAETNPTYRTGGDGSDGTCDCIGLIMGALGKDFPMHSTNYFIRYELENEPDAITDGTDLQLGDLVIKARSETNPRYDLHERYKPGGRYYIIDDLLDYYHIGVVTGVNPLIITHCTETGLINGIARDYTLEGWTHVGFADGLEYEGQWDNAAADKPAPDLAVVYSDNQDPVRLRSSPSTDKGYNTIAKVPFGTEVEVEESDGTWSTVRWNGQRGYMQNQYLRVIGMAPAIQAPEDPESRVTITLSASAARELYKALGGAL